MTKTWRLFAATALACCTLGATACAATLSQDKEALLACIDAAFPEGDIINRPGLAPGSIKAPGDCIGLIERTDPAACERTRDCAARETVAWLAVLRDLEIARLPAPNRRAVATAAAATERRARDICRAAAALSAWGGDAVRKGTYVPAQDDPCLRDAVAGQVVPLLGHARGN